MAVSACTKGTCSDAATRYADTMRELLETRRADQQANIEKTEATAAEANPTRPADPDRLLDITV